MRVDNVNIELLADGNIIIERSSRDRRYLRGGVLSQEAAEEMRRLIRLMEGVQA